MSKLGILGASTALALSLALASPALAQGKFGGGRGGGHVGGGVAMGARGGGYAGARMGGAGFAARPGGYAAMGASKFGPGAAVAAGPRTGAWTGGRTAWNGGRGYWRGGRWWPAAAGVAAGAALGSYAYYGGGYGGGPYYGDDYYQDVGYGQDDYYDTGVTVAVPAGGDASAYCAQRFRSYDPASGTYLGYDGQRHPCP